MLTFTAQAGGPCPNPRWVQGKRRTQERDAGQEDQGRQVGKPRAGLEGIDGRGNPTEASRSARNTTFLFRLLKTHHSKIKYSQCKYRDVWECPEIFQEKTAIITK